MGGAASNVSMDWSDEKKQNLLKELNNFQPGNSEITLRILLYGPVGAGKSSFINSVDSALQGRITNRALADSMTGENFTLQTKAYELKKGESLSHLPFTLIDTKGIEECESGGKTDDIIKILQDHMENKPDTPKNEKNKNTLKDKIHCLVTVLPADQISLIGDDFLTQMREVRLRARDMNIPQVIIMTNVDKACLQVKNSIKDVYTSQNIKQKVEECSSRLGVPMCYIYPLKNYHDEYTTNTELDILVLSALLNIVNFANDYVKDQKDNILNAPKNEP